jgi:hypothetical protein
MLREIMRENVASFFRAMFDYTGMQMLEGNNSTSGCCKAVTVPDAESALGCNVPYEAHLFELSKITINIMETGCVFICVYNCYQ